MHRAMRIAGLVLIVMGVAGLAWTITVWQWQDPFTGLYTRWQQHRLAQQYAKVVADWPAETTPRAHTHTVAFEAARYRREKSSGQAIGRIVIGRLGLNMIVVNGTDAGSLKRGPGRDLRTFMPGQNRLVYIAGHRTTYLAPFSDIEDIRVGDYVKLEMPYGTFTYRTTGHEIVAADDLSVLRSPRHELLRLQACHPRFFATHRYVVDARLVSVKPRP